MSFIILPRPGLVLNLESAAIPPKDCQEIFFVGKFDCGVANRGLHTKCCMFSFWNQHVAGLTKSVEDGYFFQGLYWIHVILFNISIQFDVARNFDQRDPWPITDYSFL